MDPVDSDQSATEVTANRGARFTVDEFTPAFMGDERHPIHGGGDKIILVYLPLSRDPP